MKLKLTATDKRQIAFDMICIQALTLLSHMTSLLSWCFPMMDGCTAVFLLVRSYAKKLKQKHKNNLPAFLKTRRVSTGQSEEEPI